MDILLADDERAISITLKDDLMQAEHRVTAVLDGIAARDELDSNRFDVLITDIKMPGMDGMELLKYAKDHHPQTEVIVITGYGTIESAVEAMKSGAFEYILKPFYNEEIIHLLERIGEIKHLRQENIALKAELGQRYQLDNMLGRSKVMREVFRRVTTVAPTDSNVLVEGESGTGKELIAKAIHHNSDRKGGAFVAFSCAEMPDTLLEDALFGHEEGAFTGAQDVRKGLFERARGGTLFLDEIDDTPLTVQVKLLRVLQEREFERLGGQESIPVDVRLVAATKIDLGDAVREGEFREDLYYRLNVVPLRLPPLREREGDVRLLAEHFVERYGKGRGYEVPEEVMAKMERFSWPGNVRQLENAVERAIALAGESNELKEEHLLWDLRSGTATGNGSGRVQTLDEARREAEVKTIRAVLEHAEGHKAQAAKILGISRKNLWEKMRDYGIE
ncbi:MAG: sigma-54-dependent transcriptional regulator [Planctomycetota bacterium]|jgi:DNA-binding NtrC family response regulator